MARRKARKHDGGKVLVKSFTEMCARLDFMNYVLTENREHITPKQKTYVVGNAFAIEQEWVLDPMMRSPGNGGLHGDDYTEYMNDA
jgi:hypothetical protein